MISLKQLATGQYCGKADHITVCGEGKKRETLTTGFHENIVHTGEEQEEGYQYNLNILSILTGSTVDEIKSHIDFWMSDRAGDCITFLDSLDVNDDKALKCCAHLILCIDHGAEKVFKQDKNQISP